MIFFDVAINCGRLHCYQNTARLGTFVAFVLDWESMMAALSSRTDTSTDGETDDKIMGVILQPLDI